MTSDSIGRVAGKVALVTGAARGQGRSHAVRLAAEGASIIALDVCRSIASTPYAGATREQLDETVLLVRNAGVDCEAIEADVRDLPAFTAAVERAESILGGIDIVVANAGIAGGAPIELMEPSAWAEMIDINLTGVWNTVKATVPGMIRRARGGSVIITSSANGGLKAPPNLTHYAAAKHGVVGLMRSLAMEVGPHYIRVNCVHPTAVNTPMIQNDFTYRLFRPDLAAPGRDDLAEVARSFHSLPIAWIEPVDVSNAVVFLASEESRYITGVSLPVDGGLSAR